MLTDMKKFILAGKAIFTISSPKDGGKHFTYKVSLPKDRPESAVLDFAFVSVLTGPDNTRDYTYMGMLDTRHNAWRAGETFKPSRGTKVGPDALSWRVLEFFLRWFIWGDQKLPQGYDIKHEGRCGRCGRLLTHPESIDSGIGPECRKHVFGA
jgi:hypothetical protein